VYGFLFFFCLSLERTSVTDLQCQARVGHKRENFNASCYSAYYHAATVLKRIIF
jgi:hypothetical protein